MIRIRYVGTLLLLLSIVACTFGAGTLIVGNTRGDDPDAVQITEDGVVTPFLTPDAQTPSPDFFKIYDGFLYVSNGDTVDTSSINKLTLEGEFVSKFASGGGLLRPYGFDFYEDVLYVASFRTDQILMYSATDGTYMDAFVTGDGTRDGLCNGPNHIAIHDGTLYMTTQGSVSFPNGTLSYGFPSEIVAYDIATKVGSVFIEQPDTLDGSLGFVSMLGLLIECDGDECFFYTTDFGGGLRVYKTVGTAAPTLVYAVGTTYTPGASTGALAIDNEESVIYVPAFINETTPGVVLKFSKSDGASLNGDGGFFVQSTSLVRPIGAVFMEDPSCGILGFSVFCPLTFNGIFGRILRRIFPGLFD